MGSSGQYAGIKSQPVTKKNRLGLPKTGHDKSAVDNLRKKRCLPEAIEQLVVQGLSSDAALALVTQVVTVFGLKSIYNQSEAFLELHNLEKAFAAGKTNEVAKFETRKSVQDRQDSQGVSDSLPHSKKRGFRL